MGPARRRAVKLRGLIYLVFIFFLYQDEMQEAIKACRNVVDSSCLFDNGAWWAEKQAFVMVW